MAIFLGSGMTFFQELAPAYPGLSMALYSNTSKLGIVAGQLLFGLLSGMYGDHLLFQLAAALSLIGTLAFVAATRHFGANTAQSSDA